MLPMTIQEIADAVHGVCHGFRTGTVSAVCTDSRNMIPGSLFLPWVGERFDGHRFIDAALDAGAAGCMEVLMLDSSKLITVYMLK